MRAFLVDDLILPPNSVYQFRNFGMGAERPNYGHLNDQAYRNSLKAYNLESFKLIWDLGGRSPTGNAKLDEVLGVTDKDGKPLTGAQPGSFFLGPPLPLNGKLYVLNERGNEVRLLCLRSEGQDRRQGSAAAGPRVELRPWSPPATASNPTSIAAFTPLSSPTAKASSSARPTPAPCSAWTC